MKIVLGFGSNLGDKEANISSAYTLLEDELGKMVNKSSFMESSPWGFKSDNMFLNSVAVFQTSKNPFESLEVCKEIEKRIGREGKTEKAFDYKDRLIDIDILFYEDYIVNHKDLIIPHPLITERDFVMIPLKEIFPNLIHPVLNKAIIDI